MLSDQIQAAVQLHCMNELALDLLRTSKTLLTQIIWSAASTVVTILPSLFLGLLALLCWLYPLGHVTLSVRWSQSKKQPENALPGSRGGSASQPVPALREGQEGHHSSISSFAITNKCRATNHAEGVHNIKPN